MEPLSTCSYNKWRCLIALAHVDGKVQPAEREFFVYKFKNLKDEAISKDQMDVFKEDLKNAQPAAPF